MTRTLARFSKVLLLLGVWVAAVGAISIARADCTPSPSGLVSWWRAEGNATDAAGGNNGALLNGATFATGEAGQGFSFDGINDLVKIPKAANLDVTNQVTIEFWMKASPGNAMNTYQGLVTSDFFGIEIANGYVLGPLGVEFFISTDGGASVSPSSYPDTATVNGGGAQVSAGVWHHVAGTYDGTKLQLYIDGQPWGVPNYHTGAISPMLANSFVAIGAEDGRTICPDCVGSRYFNGQIDEPTIYNRALSAAEILNLYTAGSAGKCTAAANTGVPVIFSFTPATATNGTVITISGNNFGSVAASNLVYFGAVQANVLSASVTQLTVAVPTGATFAPITVTVNGLTAAAGQPFLPTFTGNMMGLSTASFAPRLDLAAGNNPFQSTIADLDGDGRPDVVVANIFGNSVSIYRNISSNGLLTAASFAPRVDLATSGGALSPVGLAVSDVDGDGKLDIVTTDYNNNLVSVFRNLSTPGNLTTNTFAATSSPWS